MSEKQAKKERTRKRLTQEEKAKIKQVEETHRLEARALRENWLNLDNAALIYPAIGSTEWNSVFRLSAIISEKVNCDLLEQALRDTLKRYPFFNVSLCDGLFWHYFQTLSTAPKVELETNYPCRPFTFNRKNQIFRVLYLDNKISFETFHSLTDGGGAMRFFNTLLARYFELTGVKYKNLGDFDLNVRDLPVEEESEDAFHRFANNGKCKPRKETTAYAIKGALENPNILNVVLGSVDINALKACAKTYGATVNEFLSAVYLSVMIAEKHHSNTKNRHPVKLSVPVSLRRFYPTKTMRNFSQYLNYEVPTDRENASFSELIEIIKAQSKNINIDYFQQMFNANIRSERNFFVRILPLAVKDPILKFVYNRVGERLFTSTLSNLGICKLPAELDDKILNYHFILGATKLNRINLTAVTFKDKCCLTFSTRLSERRVIREFFKMLTSFNLNVEIISNV